MNIEQSFPSESEVRPPARSSTDLTARLKENRWFLLFVGLPTLLAALYYGLFAADIYTSESRFVIKSQDQKRGQLSTIASLIQTTGLSGGQEQTNEVLEYVRSRDALAALQRSMNVKARFEQPKGDFLSRFPRPFAKDTVENLFKFYGKTVDARLDSETGTAIVAVHAFDPRDALEINQRLLGLSEDLVNQLNTRSRDRAIKEAQRQVDLATERAKSARIALAQYRNSRGLIDPAKQAGGVLEIANGMVALRAALQARLEQVRQVAPANPSIPALEQQIAAISGQISAQDNRVVGSNGGIASKLGGYENLFVEQEFATENLNVANASLVQARGEAQRQQFYLERVVAPNLPDMALLPRRIMSILIIAAAATCLYFIGWMLIVGILEHAPDD
jgi:capsular polysaccharide transport system permease protein